MKTLKFEFRKLFKSKALYVCSALSIIFTLLSVYIKSQSDNPVNTFSAEDSLMSAFDNGMIPILISIFIPLFVCEDNNLGTLKNIYAKGFSRTKLWISKYIVSFVAFTIFSCLAFATSYISAGHYFGHTDEVSKYFNYSISGQILLMIAYHAMYFMIATLVGKAGVAIAINMIGLSVVTLTFSAVDALQDFVDIDFSKYLLDNVWTYVSHVDVYVDVYADDRPSFQFVLVISLVYTVLSFVSSIIVNSRKQL